MTHLTEAPTLRTLFTGRLVTDGTLTPDGAVAIEDGRVAYAGPLAQLPVEWSEVRPDHRVPSGATIIPGLVDSHLHGGAGGEFGIDLEAARTGIAEHHRHGSTTLIGSLVSAGADDLVHATHTLGGLVASGELAGIHLEGPFIAAARKGAHDPGALRDGDPRLVEALAEAAETAGAPGAIRHLTFAPDRAGTHGLPATLHRHGIHVAVGHTEADAALTARVLRSAADATGGPAIVTHIFNAMPPIRGRAPGTAVGAIRAALGGAAVLEVVADGVHLSPDTVRMLFEVVGPESISLISDAMAATGLPDGDYTLGGLPVVVADGTARLTGSGAIAGSVAHLVDCLRWAVQTAGIDLADAVLAATATPAKTFALDAGTLVPGAVADIVVLDADLRPVLVTLGQAAGRLRIAAPR